MPEMSMARIRRAAVGRAPITEALIEKDVCRLARKWGWLVFKFSSPNQRGVPDRILIRRGRVMFIEFKAPGKKLTEIQGVITNRMKMAGAEIHVIDNVEDGMLLVCPDDD